MFQYELKVPPFAADNMTGNIAADKLADYVKKKSSMDFSLEFQVFQLPLSFFVTCFILYPKIAMNDIVCMTLLPPLLYLDERQIIKISLSKESEDGIAHTRLIL